MAGEPTSTHLPEVVLRGDAAGGERRAVRGAVVPPPARLGGQRRQVARRGDVCAVVDLRTPCTQARRRHHRHHTWRAGPASQAIAAVGSDQLGTGVGVPGEGVGGAKRCRFGAESMQRPSSQRRRLTLPCAPCSSSSSSSSSHLHMVHDAVPVDVGVQLPARQVQLANGAPREEVHHLNALLQVNHQRVGRPVAAAAVRAGRMRRQVPPRRSLAHRQRLQAKSHTSLLLSAAWQETRPSLRWGPAPPPRHAYGSKSRANRGAAVAPHPSRRAAVVRRAVPRARRAHAVRAQQPRGGRQLVALGAAGAAGQRGRLVVAHAACAVRLPPCKAAAWGATMRAGECASERARA